MTLLIQSATQLSTDKIVTKLHELRKNCAINFSHYAVSALIEVKKDNIFFYVSGVNVENATLNRLSTHGEQNAILATITLLSRNAKVSSIWIMGAPDHLKENSTDPIADIAVSPCGHCRQILLSLTDKETELYGVSFNGKITQFPKLDELLPNAFSERNLNLTTQSPTSFQTENRMTVFSPPKLQPHLLIDLINERTAALDEREIQEYFRHLLPHIINPSYRTSPIISCILKFNNPIQYIPGILVQDPAFLTTEAIFVAMGLAVTHLGANKLDLQEIYVFGSAFEKFMLNGSETDLISQFSNKNIPVYFHTIKGRVGQYTIIKDHASTNENLKTDSIEYTSATTTSTMG